MPLTCSRVWPFVAGLFVLPLLAQADPLNNGALGLIVYAALFLMSLALLSPLLTVWSYLRPSSRGLFALQLLLLALALWAGGGMHYAFRGQDWPLLGRFNPLWELAVPLGVWLNGSMLARRARHEAARVVWTAVAVLALGNLLVMMPFALLLHLFPQGGGLDAWVQMVYRVVVLVLLIASWCVVLRQVGRPVALWQPWWRAPLVFTGVSFANYLCDLVLTNVYTHYFMLSLEWGEVLQAVLNGVAGMVALRLTQPAAHPESIATEG
jgi:hypothetical protein